jgi:transcriptional regulator with XRE-family HTH domain
MNFEQDIPTIADAVRIRLGELTVNQNEAARQMGVESARVSQWVNGRRPAPGYWVELMAWLDCSTRSFGVMMLQTEWLLASKTGSKVPDRSKPEVDAMASLINGQHEVAPRDYWQSLSGLELRSMLNHFNPGVSGGGR